MQLFWFFTGKFRSSRKCSNEEGMPSYISSSNISATGAVHSHRCNNRWFTGVQHDWWRCCCQQSGLFFLSSLLTQLPKNCWPKEFLPSCWKKTPQLKAPPFSNPFSSSLLFSRHDSLNLSSLHNVKDKRASLSLLLTDGFGTNIWMCYTKKQWKPLLVLIDQCVFCVNCRLMWQSHRQLRRCNQVAVLLEEWNMRSEFWTIYSWVASSVARSQIEMSPLYFYLKNTNAYKFLISERLPKGEGREDQVGRYNYVFMCLMVSRLMMWLFCANLCRITMIY